jgi:hypothetical protein
VLVEDPSEEVRAEAAALRSLLWFQIYGGDAAKRGVEAQIGLVRRSARRGTGGTAAIEILYGAGDLATVREAAKSHPDAEVRAVAQSYAGRRAR